jgi:hypothetical protein
VEPSQHQASAAIGGAPGGSHYRPARGVIELSPAR